MFQSLSNARNVNKFAFVTLFAGCAMVATSAFGAVSSNNSAFADEVSQEQVIAAEASQQRAEALPVDLVKTSPEAARTAADATVVTAASTDAVALDITPNKPLDNVLPFISSTGARDITTGTQILPKADVAIARALSYVGNANMACEDGECYRLCDYLAGKIWGYESSGYYSAATHWETAKATGVAHVGDKNPPLGAALFYTGDSSDGHIAIYVGNGMVVTNNSGGSAGSNVYLMPANRWGGYLGWALPIFHGGEVGSAL